MEALDLHAEIHDHFLPKILGLTNSFTLFEAGHQIDLTFAAFVFRFISESLWLNFNPTSLAFFYSNHFSLMFSSCCFLQIILGRIKDKRLNYTYIYLPAI